MAWDRRAGRAALLLAALAAGPLAAQRAADARHGARAEDDVRQRTVRRDDHRAADRNDVRRRPVVATCSRVEHERERARRIVPHDETRLHAEFLERARLVLRVLGHAAPERPRVGDDDPDLHRRETMPSDYGVGANVGCRTTGSAACNVFM